MSSEAVVNLVSDMEPIETFDEEYRHVQDIKQPPPQPHEEYRHVQDIEQTPPQPPPQQEVEDEDEEEEVEVVLDDEYYDSQDSGYFSLTLEEEDKNDDEDDNKNIGDDDNKKNVIDDEDDDNKNEKIDQVLQGVVDIQHKVSTTNDLISGMKDVMSPPLVHPPPPHHRRQKKRMISPIQYPNFNPDLSFSKVMFDSIGIIIISGLIEDYGRVIGKRGARIDSLREKHQVDIALNRKEEINHFPYICINYKTAENRWRGVNAAEEIIHILEGPKNYRPKW